MKKVDIVRAWRDPEYYASLTEAEKAQVPAHPAGTMDLEDQDLTFAAGGVLETFCEYTCCQEDVCKGAIFR